MTSIQSTTTTSLYEYCTTCITFLGSIYNSRSIIFFYDFASKKQRLKEKIAILFYKVLV